MGEKRTRVTTGKAAERKLCWRVVRQCNLHCTHCLAGYKNIARRDFLERELNGALDKIVDARVTRITWTGGEPTLCRHLPNLLQQCAKHGISSVLTTHGLSLTKRILRAITPGVDTIRFSFDGLEETHNRIRGGKFFRKTFEVANSVKCEGFQIEANISYMSGNCQEIPELMEQLYSIGMSKIVLMSLMLRESAVDNNVLCAQKADVDWLYGVSESAQSCLGLVLRVSHSLAKIGIAQPTTDVERYCASFTALWKHTSRNTFSWRMFPKFMPKMI